MTAKPIECGSHVKGRYLGLPFSGWVTYRRFNEANHRHIIYFVDLDYTLTVQGDDRNSLSVTVNVLDHSDPHYATNIAVG